MMKAQMMKAQNISKISRLSDLKLVCELIELELYRYFANMQCRKVEIAFEIEKV